MGGSAAVASHCDTFDRDMKEEPGMNRVEKALSNHKKGYNCSQSVACAFCDRTGVDEKTMFQVMEAFGLGGGDMQGTCGAVAGAAAIAGLINSTANLDSPDSKQKTYKIVKDMNARFREMNGSTICKELKGVETGKALRSCDGCIEDAVKILCEHLGE